MKKNHQKLNLAFVSVTVLILLTSVIAHADNIYVSDFGDGKIYKFDSSGNRTVFASPGNPPIGLAFDSHGNLYASFLESCEIYKFDSKGNMSFFASLELGAQSWGLEFDRSDNLYVTNSYDSITRFDSNGNKTTFASGLNTPMGLAFDNYGNLYAAEHEGGTIEKFDSSGQGAVFASGLNNPFDLAFDSSGYLYVTSGSGTIEKFDSSGNRSTFASALNGPMGLEFDSSGYLYAAIFGNESAGNGTIEKFDSSGNGSVFASGLYQPVFIAVQVPEPATLLLLGLGAVIVRRKRG